MVQRTFLVTGATKVAGLAISKRLSAARHDVVGIARGPLPPFPRTRVLLDLEDEKRSAETFVELAQRHSLGGVVNNAGLGKHQPIGEVDVAVVGEHMRFNLHSPINPILALASGPTPPRVACDSTAAEDPMKRLAAFLAQHV